MHADTWWMALRDGRLAKEEAEVLRYQHEQLQLNDEDFSQVKDVLNKKLREEKRRITLGITPLGKRARNLVCWDFEIEVQDLLDAEKGSVTMAVAWKAKLVAWLFTLFLRSGVEGNQMRFQIALNVSWMACGKLLAWQPGQALEYLREWFVDVAGSTYLTVLATMFCGTTVRVLRFLCDVKILHLMWRDFLSNESWADHRRWLLWYVVCWCLSAYMKNIIDTWDKAMKPRLPFLNVRLVRKYNEWMQKVRA